MNEFVTTSESKTVTAHEIFNNNRKNLKMKKKNTYIVSFWNSTSIFDGFHTIAVKPIQKTKMYTLNDRPRKETRIYKSKKKLKPRILTFKGLLKERPFIIGYRLRGNKG